MAAFASVPVRSPGWTLTYQGVQISGRIEAMVRAITFTTFETGASPDLEVELEDRDRRWQRQWFPQRGDQVTAQIGYAGETLAPCGTFQVDEVSLDGPPDVVKMKCLAVDITPDARTPQSQKFESQSLQQIAQSIAAKHGWSLLWQAEPINIQFQRRTQNQETDLEFLHRLANENNYDFTVKANQLIFFSRTNIETTPSIVTLSRGENAAGGIKKFSFRAKTEGTYAAATHSYFDPDTKALITSTVAASPAVAVGDTLNIQGKCDNAQDAAQKAKAALHAHNMLIVTGSVTTPGSTLLIAGRKGTIAGFGQFDGDYIFTKCTHRLSRPNSYETNCEIRSINAPAVGS